MGWVSVWHWLVYLFVLFMYFFCCSLLKLCQIFVVEHCYIFCSLSATYAQSRIDFHNLERDVFKQDWICITMCVQNVFMAWASSF